MHDARQDHGSVNIRDIESKLLGAEGAEGAEGLRGLKGLMGVQGLAMLDGFTFCAAISAPGLGFRGEASRVRLKGAELRVVGLGSKGLVDMAWRLRLELHY